MDYLTRLLLELKEAEYTPPVLPRMEERSLRTGVRRAPEEAAAAPLPSPEQAAASRQTAVQQLHRLLDEAQAAGRMFEAHSAGTKGGEQPVSLHRPAETGAGRFSSPVPEAGDGLTPEAFSRFFERDARRYG